MLCGSVAPRMTGLAAPRPPGTQVGEDTVEFKATLPANQPYADATWGGAATVLPSGDVFVMGGCFDEVRAVTDLLSCTNVSARFAMFNPTTGAVAVPHTTIAPTTAALLQPGMSVPAPVYFHTMVVFENRLYIVGGLTSFSAADFANPAAPPFHKMATTTLVRAPLPHLRPVTQCFTPCGNAATCYSLLVPCGFCGECRA